MAKMIRYRAHYRDGSDFVSNLTGYPSEFDPAGFDQPVTHEDVWAMITNNDDCLWCYAWQGPEDPSVVQEYLASPEYQQEAA